MSTRAILLVLTLCVTKINADVITDFNKIDTSLNAKNFSTYFNSESNKILENRIRYLESEIENDFRTMNYSKTRYNDGKKVRAATFWIGVGAMLAGGFILSENSNNNKKMSIAAGISFGVGGVISLIPLSVGWKKGSVYGDDKSQYENTKSQNYHYITELKSQQLNLASEATQKLKEYSNLIISKAFDGVLTQIIREKGNLSWGTSLEEIELLNILSWYENKIYTKVHNIENDSTMFQEVKNEKTDALYKKANVYNGYFHNFILKNGIRVLQFKIQNPERDYQLTQKGTKKVEEFYNNEKENYSLEDALLSGDFVGYYATQALGTLIRGAIDTYNLQENIDYFWYYYFIENFTYEFSYGTKINVDYRITGNKNDLFNLKLNQSYEILAYPKRVSYSLDEGLKIEFDIAKSSFKKSTAKSKVNVEPLPEQQYHVAEAP